MKLTTQVLLIAALLFLVGCASNVNRNTSSVKEEKFQVIQFKSFKSVSLDLDVNAKVKHQDNTNFSPDELLSKIKLTLLANEYLKTENNNSNLSVEVVITNVRVRSGAAAILLGFFAGADYITGNIFVKDGDKVLDKFEVDISYAWGGVAGGDTNTRMVWMYESFANKMMEELKKIMPPKS
jgi:hypothetical protein